MTASSDSRIRVVIDSGIQDLIPEFLESVGGDVDRILEAVREGDMGTARIVGHSLKGSGGSYGFDGITDIGRTMEDAARIGDAAAVIRGAEDLREYLSRLDIVYR